MRLRISLLKKGASAPVRGGIMVAAAVACFSVTFAAADASSHQVTPRSVEWMIHKYGPRQTVRVLAATPRRHSDFGDFDVVLSGIASGNSRWLALVPQLERGADAGAAEALVVSVARALPKNPAGVLRLIRARPSWRDACTYPMIEPTPAEAHAYFRSAIPAVKSVDDRSLRGAKRVCLVELTKASRS